MDEINGQYGGKKVFELLMDSGEYVHVQPLSIYVVQALREKSRTLYPYPDKARYERKLEDAKAIEPGQVIPAEENPEYQALYDAADEKQQTYVNLQCIALSVEPLQGRQAMIAKYKDRVKQMRAVMDLPDDAWDATLRFCIISSKQDLGKISNAIMGNALPREEDILNGMRIFRCYVRQETPDGSHSEQKPQSVDADIAVEA